VSSVRLWILLLAGTCFAAGLGAGVLVGESRAAQGGPRAGPGDHSADYRALFEGTFELSPQRRELVAELLRRYDEEVEEIRQRALARSIAEVEDELARVGLRYRDAIRNHVLPPPERERFDRLVAQGAPPLPRD
jgi:hypothetical protein